MTGERAGLHDGVVQAQAHVSAAAEGNERVTVPGALCINREAHRIESIGVRPYVRHVMGVNRSDADRTIGRNAKALEFQLSDRMARDGCDWRHEAQRFLEGHFRTLQLVEAIE